MFLKLIGGSGWMDEVLPFSMYLIPANIGVKVLLFGRKDRLKEVKLQSLHSKQGCCGLVEPVSAIGISHSLEHKMERDLSELEEFNKGHRDRIIQWYIVHENLHLQLYLISYIGLIESKSLRIMGRGVSIPPYPVTDPTEDIGYHQEDWCIYIMDHINNKPVSTEK
ncbi:hypothetical protein BDR06DRAFT_972632 [Suillus hirtellus]|nr:hypothetical protein BDR06DRAFT_972632 [Suillus hirtellus]